MKLHRYIILGLVIAVMACKTSSMMPVAYAANQPTEQTARCIPTETATKHLQQAGMKPIFGVHDENQVIMVFINPDQDSYAIIMIPASNPEVVCLLSIGNDYKLTLENLLSDKDQLHI